MKMKPDIILPAFDQFLTEKGEKFDGIVIGASALVLMGVMDRDTIDVDILDPKIPPRVLGLAAEFHDKMEKDGTDMIEKWLNNGPDSLLDVLPKGWRSRLVPVFKGKALNLQTLGRLDLIKTKLFAYCDREEQDRFDLTKLAPTKEELIGCFEWVSYQEVNPMWPDHVRKKFISLSMDLGDELQANDLA